MTPAELFIRRMCAYLNEHGHFPLTPTQLEAAVEFAESQTKEVA